MNLRIFDAVFPKILAQVGSDFGSRASTYVAVDCDDGTGKIELKKQFFDDVVVG